jgi:hypothetical protein
MHAYIAIIPKLIKPHLKYLDAFWKAMIPKVPKCTWTWKNRLFGTRDCVNAMDVFILSKKFLSE